MERNRLLRMSTRLMTRIQALSHTCLTNSTDKTDKTNKSSKTSSTKSTTNTTAPSTHQPIKTIRITKSTLSPSLSSSSTNYKISKPLKPRQPRPWRWECCKCKRKWRMGATTRCLSCGHRICSSDPDNISRVCWTEFDYRGWRRYAEWKKDLKRINDELDMEEEEDSDNDDDLLGKSSTGGRGVVVRPAKRRLLSVALRYKKYSCFNDCVYPSQCFHEERRVKDTLAPIAEEDIDEDTEEEELEEEKVEEVKIKQEEEVFDEWCSDEDWYFADWTEG